VARFAGQNVHKRLVTEETYKEGNWEMALKKAFLGTDEDILASKSFLRICLLPEAQSCKDPAHTRDPSGCTAVAALLTSDNKIYVVSPWNDHDLLFLTYCRQMLVIPVP
jgi:protein phosphatase 2C family protein 2/3